MDVVVHVHALARERFPSIAAHLLTFLHKSTVEILLAICYGTHILCFDLLSVCLELTSKFAFLMHALTLVSILFTKLTLKYVLTNRSYR